MNNANERIKYLRNNLNISQEQLGKAIGISKSGISAIENGTRNVTEKHIKLLANAYNVNEEWLRYGTGEIFEQLTDQEKVIKYTTILLKDTKSSIAESIKNLITIYEQLDDTSKEVLEKIIDTYVEKAKKVKDTKKSLNLKKIESEQFNILNAAHERTDIISTPEGQAHDDAIMDDDSEWE